MVPLEARYFDNPEAFLPERWKSEAIKQLPKYAYFPFGGGPRLCIGNSFAMMETVLLLATMVQKLYRQLLCHDGDRSAAGDNGAEVSPEAGAGSSCGAMAFNRVRQGVPRLQARGGIVAILHSAYHI